MIIPKLGYALDDGLIKKLDLMIKRCEQSNPKRDALLLVEGGEGEGKTTLSAECADYVRLKTKRVFDNKRIFFDVEKMVNFAKNTKNQIIIWDEPALDGLSVEWWKETQKNLIKLLMMARKKRHFFIFNITKFYKFNEYIVVDRALGLIHVYSRNEIEPGRFVYIKKRALEWLFNSYRTSKKRSYKKYTSFRGTFPDCLDKIIDIESYEREKDRAIMSIGSKKNSEDKKELIKLKLNVANLKLPIKTRTELAEQLGYSIRTLQRWVKEGEKTPINTLLEGDSEHATDIL